MVKIIAEINGYSTELIDKLIYKKTKQNVVELKQYSNLHYTSNVVSNNLKKLNVDTITMKKNNLDRILVTNK